MIWQCRQPTRTHIARQINKKCCLSIQILSTIIFFFNQSQFHFNPAFIKCNKCKLCIAAGQPKILIKIILSHFKQLHIHSNAKRINIQFVLYVKLLRCRQQGQWKSQSRTHKFNVIDGNIVALVVSFHCLKNTKLFSMEENVSIITLLSCAKFVEFYSVLTKDH